MKELLDRLEAALGKELNRQQRLYTTMLSKKDAIVSQDLTALDGCLSELSALAKEGESLDQELKELLQSLAPKLGFDPTRVTLKQILQKLHGLRPSLESLRTELREQAVKVSDFNRNLGALVRNYREVYSSALTIILEAAGVGVAGECKNIDAGAVLNTEG